METTTTTKGSPSPPPCPGTVTVRRNPHRKARNTPFTTTAAASKAHTTKTHDIPSFPIDDILSIQIPKSDPNPSISENLKVFLRIKPLKASSSTVATKPRKNAWLQSKNPAKKTTMKKEKRMEEVCVSVNDSQSVSVTPPVSLQELKRSKTEVYEGFSYVFSGTSSQSEVYEKMVEPLVEDFLRGKSGMLAALGPSGSGKTHTVFGSPREPGMVPLALRRIFNRRGDKTPGLSRSFYLSVFEIYSERGKGERASDLLGDGGSELCMQQSSLKGIQEILISSVTEAEALIGQAMLKRATAMTNSNSQSSRSQCIINVRAASVSSAEETRVQPSDAVLTIVDLAGAEREKRTGNQGARLLESNFINNTSMVFGQCLRSLLEHQKNPKKALQKHFQNSLLTRYLRDYLEGKKRMALILTVKAGEEDYLDTSSLLKQASPYMKIKFDNVEEVCNKRQLQTFPRVEQNKKIKLSRLNPSKLKQLRPRPGSWVRALKFEMEEVSAGDINQPFKEGHSQMSKADRNNGSSPKAESINHSKCERSHMIMQSFAKAIWNVLKQHNEKLKVAESEIHSLRERLRNEQLKSHRLEEELIELKSFCAYSKQNLKVGSFTEVEATLQPGEQFEPDISLGDERNEVARSHNISVAESNNILEGCKSSPIPSGDVRPQVQDTALSPNVGFADNDQDSTVTYSDHGGTAATCLSVESLNQPSRKIVVRSSGDRHCNEDSNDSNELGIRDDHPGSEATDFIASSSQLSDTDGSNSFLSSELAQQPHEEEEDQKLLRKEGEFTSCCKSVVPHIQTKPRTTDKTLKVEKLKRDGHCNEDFDHLKALGIRDEHPGSDTTRFVASSSQSSDTDESNSCSSLKLAQHQHQEEGDKQDQAPLPKEIGFTPERKRAVGGFQTKPGTYRKTLNAEKPKRRLMPASSILLVREMNALDIEDEIEKPKANGGGKKTATDGRQRTQGSISLLRLLKSNLHI